jgi:hypothetical protein
MTEFFGTNGIPDDSAYWDVLAARVAGGARAGGFARLATTPAAWAAVLLLVAAAGLLVLATRGRERASIGSEIAQALAPADYPGRTLAAPNDASALGSLLFQNVSVREAR